MASKGLIWWLSSMAAFQSMSSAAILTEVIGLKWAGFAQAVAASLSAGTAVFVGASREDVAPEVNHIEAHLQDR